MYDFVTGATGCVGRRVVRELVGAGRHLICAVRNLEAVSADPLFQSPQIKLIPCDFTQEEWRREVPSALAQCENVFHLAGEMPHRPTCHFDESILRRVNFESVLQLSELARAAHIKRFLYVSSVAVYGDTFQGPCDESSPFEPTDAYAKTKVAAEQGLISMAHQGGPAALMIRPGLIYGDRDNGVINKIIGLVAKGRFAIIGDGNNVRAISSVSLVAETLCRLAKTDDNIAILNVLDPRSPTLKELTRDIADLLGVRPPRRVPKAVAYPTASVFSFLAWCGLGNSFKISDVRKISTSNPISSHRFKALFGQIPDYYQQELAVDVAWHRARGAKGETMKSELRPVGSGQP